MSKFPFALTAMLAAVILLPLPAHAADSKAKFDFTPYRGVYISTWSLTANGATAPGTVKTIVKVPKGGKSMTIKITGTGILGGSATFPISATIKFNASRLVTSNALLAGYLGPVATKNSRFSGKKVFAFSQTAATGAMFSGSPISGTINYRLAFTKRGVSLTGSGVIVTSITSAVTISVSGRK